MSHALELNLHNGVACQKPVIFGKHIQICAVILVLRYPGTTDTAEAINQLGCKHVSKSVSETHVDEKNKVVTTCAFICKAPLHEIFDGIGAMVQDVLRLA